ncbi:hypothetical protein [Janibacter anophelis]|uniref:hypothetical protein n=1 Tax=Janibacter anophelis TaxID=319054 RepID=UPI000836106D|nr:hypothetical protein [Janibacter anophelis]
MKDTTVHLICYSVVAVTAFVVGAVMILILGAGDGASSATAVTSTRTSTVTSTAKVTDAGSTTTTTAPPTTTTRTTTATVTAKPPPPATDIPGDGTFEVGVDVEPGTYISDAPSSGSCYWARLSSPTGTDNILDNNISRGQSIVTISTSDAFFETSRCNGWTKR